MTVRQIFYCSMMLVVPAVGAIAQEAKRPQQKDTAQQKIQKADQGLLFDRPSLVLPLSVELAGTPNYYLRLLDPASAASLSFSRREVEIIDLTGPLKLQLARQNENRTLYSVFGAVKAGGLAYLAYKHIQKHGWK